MADTMKEQCTIPVVINCQERQEKQQNCHKLTAKEIRYIQQKILKRKFTNDEYDEHYQEIWMINAKVLGCL